MNAQTERLMLQGAAGQIEALRDCPTLASKGVVVISHPHPLYGGTMDNKVVQTLARAFVQAGWTAIRFNFRGVGASQGVHDEGRGEAEDLLGIIAEFAPLGSALALAGFSFGSFVTSKVLSQVQTSHDVQKIAFIGTATIRFDVSNIPTDLHERMLIVHGEQDDTISLQSVLDWARPQNLPVSVFPGCGHFFHGYLPQLRNAVFRHLMS